LISNTSTPLQITLAAEAQVAGGQFLLQEQILNTDISDIPSRNSKTNSFQKKRAEFIGKVNVNKKQSMEAMQPLTWGVQMQLL
jgi:hypothetical protein